MLYRTPLDDRINAFGNALCDMTISVTRESECSVTTWMDKVAGD